MHSTVKNSTLRFVKRGEIVQLDNVPPTRTLLQVLREDLRCTDTKEGCGEGDCGACTVVVSEAVDGELQHRAINSCIRMAHSVNGMAVWTAGDIAAPARLHPAQQAMLDCHGSQCGFCTPGFVMSLFGMYHNRVCQGQTIGRATAQQDLAGNLCRCTGYRPILAAAQQMHHYPAMPINGPLLLQKLEQTNQSIRRPVTNLAYIKPSTLKALLQDRAQHPSAQLVAGCTDVGLWVTKQHQQFDQVIDLTATTELRRIERYPQHIAIGAAVPLADAFAAIVQDRPQLADFAQRFAGLPVRNSGTMGGNVANGSPIGDSMPLLIALQANVVLMRWQDGRVQHREMQLERLYTGYRKNVIAAGEVLAWIKLPLPLPAYSPLPASDRAAGGATEFSRVYKLSKRYDDDISAVCLALNLQLNNGRVQRLSIGVGGVAATPVRAVHTEAACTAKPWARNTLEAAKTALQNEFTPLSDLRASAAYRRQALAGLLERFWLESQGAENINLESFVMPTEAVAV